MKFDWIRQHKQIACFLALFTIALLFLQCLSDFNRGKSYIAEDGQVVAIKREDFTKTQSLPFRIEVVIDGKKESFDVVVTLKESAREEAEKTVTSSSTSLQDIISDLVTEVEASDSERVNLPLQLKDGTRIFWKKPYSANKLLILLLFPLGLVYLYRGEQQKKKEAEKRRKEEIRKALPAFNNQLLLLMNSGLIFHDAFYRISFGYESRESKDTFSQLILEMGKRTEDSGKSLVTVMEESARKAGVREFSRLTNIITDNQYKGVNLREKLQSENDMLWGQRKKIAEEKGKAAETKLAFPLALLLLVLILITAAPAMMNM